MFDKNSLGQYGEYRQPYQSELDYFKNNTNVGGMAAEDNKIILNPYSSLTDEEKHQVGLNEGVRLFLRENPNYIGSFGLTKQQKQSLGNYSNNINDIRSTILARILTNDPSAGDATIRQKFNANRVRNAINKRVGQYGLGNIDLYARPQVKMPDGKIATVKSMSFNDGSKEVLIPTVSDDGRIMTNDEAIDNYYKTGKYLGKFNTVDEANKYAEQLHNEQDRYYNKNRANNINGLRGGLNMDNTFMNDFYKSYMNPQDYYRVYEKFTGFPGKANSYQQLGAMAQSLMGDNQDPRLQQLSQMLRLYQQGLR